MEDRFSFSGPNSSDINSPDDKPLQFIDHPDNRMSLTKEQLITEQDSLYRELELLREFVANVAKIPGTAHGGGNWRRIILQTVADLEEKLKGLNSV